MGGLFIWIGVFFIFVIIGSALTAIVERITDSTESGIIFGVLLFAFGATELFFNSGIL